MNIKRFAIILAASVLAGCPGRSSKLFFSGTVEMTEHNVGTPVAGRLVRLFVDEGDPVRKGQLLGWLEHYAKAQRDYDRSEQLLKEGGATRQQVEDSELAMEDQRIVSPVDGFVLVKIREAGEVVPAGGSIVDIGDAGDVWARIYVPEGQINRVHIGQEADVRLDGLDKTLRGRVRTIAPQAEFTPRNVQTEEERVQQSFAVKVALSEPPGSVRPGVAADVTLKE